MCNMLGLGDMNADQLASKLEETLPVIRSVSEQFKDPVSNAHITVVVSPLYNSNDSAVVTAIDLMWITPSGCMH